MELLITSIFIFICVYIFIRLAFRDGIRKTLKYLISCTEEELEDFINFINEEREQGGL